MGGSENIFMLTDIIGTSSCIASEDGNTLHTFLSMKLCNDEKVTLDFSGAEDITSAFLNASVGKLYNGEFSHDHIRASLSVTNISPDDLYILKRVVDRAKQFYSDPEVFEAAAREVSDDEPL